MLLADDRWTWQFPQCPSAVFNFGGFILQKSRARTKDCTPIISHVNSRQLKGTVGTATHCALCSGPFRAALVSRPGNWMGAAALTSVFTRSERGQRLRGRVTWFS